MPDILLALKKNRQIIPTLPSRSSQPVSPASWCRRWECGQSQCSVMSSTVGGCTSCNGIAGGRAGLSLMDGDKDFLEQIPSELGFEVYSRPSEGEEVHLRKRKWQVERLGDEKCDGMFRKVQRVLQSLGFQMFLIAHPDL